MNAKDLETFDEQMQGRFGADAMPAHGKDSRSKAVCFDHLFFWTVTARTIWLLFGQLAGECIHSELVADRKLKFSDELLGCKQGVRFGRVVIRRHGAAHLRTIDDIASARLPCNGGAPVTRFSFVGNYRIFRNVSH
jgi:hypothetical protein